MSQTTLPIKKEPDFFYPASISEAFETAQKGNYLYLGGGTSLAFSKPKNHVGFIDLSYANLDFIKEDSEFIEIGSTINLGQLYLNNNLSQYCEGIINNCAKNVATTTVRNLVTIGGNIIQHYWWSDMATVLIALDAKLIVYNGNYKTIPISQIFKEHPKKFFNDNSILKSVILPLSKKNYKGKYLNYAKTATDFTCVSLAVTADFDGKTVKDIRIVFGGLENLPVSFTEGEAYIKGKTLDHESILSLKNRACEVLNPLPNMKYTAQYRRHLAGVLLGQVLEEFSS